MAKLHRSDFTKGVKSRYPDLKDQLNMQNGLLTFEVSVLLRFLQEKIDAGERQDVQGCLNLIAYYFDNGNAALRNAIGVGICEEVSFEDSKKNSRSWAIEFIPARLRSEREAWLRSMGLSK